ncbi:2-oxoacid ferredoxin oxidoreductase [Candidatus Bipolaricaulota bacterium]|nr:2-oxoacid ferredoxin oxidoreductase [Candidatus Bipolaricaulota bacterium]
MTKITYRSDVENQWCPGCPNFGILAALKKALLSLDLPPHKVCLVSGIGQAAKLPHYVGCNVFNGLHGRSIPAALGIHVANPELTTIVTSGDGCLYGEGGNHFLHTLRRNPNMTVLSHDNQIYALTKGQASPMTRRGEKTRLQFDGVEVDPSQMLATAIVHGCTFVARGYAGDIEGLALLIEQAIAHRGLAILDIIQPCITWGSHPVDWYRERIADVPDDHDPTDRNAAIDLALETPNSFPVGVLYRLTPQETFAASYRKRVGERPLYLLPPIERDVLDAHIDRLTIETATQDGS